ncbi:hypothetical protein BT69DRAFT_801133 [Atractiella rhizophila]|nr:hypothetical protein BT69DRAFT_801133 [Atractiella rhizophila]
MAGKTNSQIISDIVAQYSRERQEAAQTELRATYPSSEAFGVGPSRQASSPYMSAFNDSRGSLASSYYTTEAPEIPTVRLGPLARSPSKSMDDNATLADRPQSMVPLVFDEHEHPHRIATPTHSPFMEGDELEVVNSPHFMEEERMPRSPASPHRRSPAHLSPIATPKRQSPSSPTFLDDAQLLIIPPKDKADGPPSASTEHSSFLDMGSPRDEGFVIPEFASPLPPTPSTAKASSMARPRSASWIDFDQTSLFQPSLHRDSRPSFLDFDRPEDEEHVGEPEGEEDERRSFLDMSPPESRRSSKHSIAFPFPRPRGSTYDSPGFDPTSRPSLDIPASRMNSLPTPSSVSGPSSTNLRHRFSPFSASPTSRPNSDNQGSERANSFLSIIDSRFGRAAVRSTSPISRENRDSYLSSNMSLSSLSQVHQFPRPPRDRESTLRHSIPESMEAPRSRRSLSVSDIDTAEVRRSLDSGRQRFSTSSIHAALQTSFPLRHSEDSGVEPFWNREEFAGKRQKFLSSEGKNNPPNTDDGNRVRRDTEYRPRRVSLIQEQSVDENSN